MPESLTACVIARDEEERLPGCLESLSFCDEVIVVDGGSRDRTVAIAEAAGARVVANPWPGFAVQRNFALDHASGDWVLEVDADERVTAELAADIGALLADPPAGTRMAAIPRCEVFLGRALGASARHPRYFQRLFRRGCFRHDESRLVHEGLWPDGPTVPLRGELEHLLASTWGEAVRDAWAYARLEAQQRCRPGAGEAVLGITLRPVAKLAYRLLLYGGWRDGWRGATKIGLECAGDSLATLLRLRRGPKGGGAGFGQQPPRLGAVRIVGISLGVRDEPIAGWLERASARGADVSLICARRGGGGRLRRHPVVSRSPASLARALDAEEQIRPIDAVLPAGRWERLVLKLLPGSLTGAMPPLAPGDDPAQAVQEVERWTRTARSEPEW